MQHDLLLTHLQCASVTQDAKQGVRNLLSRHSLLAELQAKGVLNIIPQVTRRFQCLCVCSDHHALCLLYVVATS